MENDFRVLLYYHYTTIEDPEQFAQDHLAFCKQKDLKGRILVANEGINGTVSGLKKDTDQYKLAMESDPLFEGIVFKEDVESGHVFKKNACTSSS